MKTAMVVLAGLLAVAPAVAQVVQKQLSTGNDHLAICGTPVSPIDGAGCWGMAFGLAIGLASALSEHVCLPLNVPGSQLNDILMRYLREHPEERHGPIAQLAFEALREAFPCSGDARN